MVQMSAYKLFGFKITPTPPGVWWLATDAMAQAAGGTEADWRLAIVANFLSGTVHVYAVIVVK